MKALLLVVLLLALGACGTGEGDPCNDAATACDDAKTLRTCGGSVDAIGATRHWHIQPCTGSNPACVVRPATPDMLPTERNSRAFCAASPSPDPLCASHARGSFCHDGHVAVCKGGFLVNVSDCRSDEDCFESTGETGGCAVCGPAADTAPDPGCANEARTCHDNAVVACSCGFRTRKQQDCPAPQVCVAAASGGKSDAFCAVSSQPDPRCAGHDFLLLCLDGDVVSCYLDHPVAHASCASGCDEATATCR